jgi:NAD(P)-dependent dehydrogenase (short-subunit alcohol dehydrogenase family)
VTADPSYHPPNLHGVVALVAGATRGVGRGTALALGEAGATVYGTGRSTRTKPISSCG